MEHRPSYHFGVCCVLLKAQTNTDGTILHTKGALEFTYSQGQSLSRRLSLSLSLSACVASSLPLSLTYTHTLSSQVKPPQSSAVLWVMSRP